MEEQSRGTRRRVGAVSCMIVVPLGTLFKQHAITTYSKLLFSHRILHMYLFR
jgi:hypothetical protein